MYFDPDGDCSNANEETMADIKETIGSGTFNTLDERIINVIYLNASDVSFYEEITTSSSASDTKVPGYALLLLAFAALVLIVPVLILVVRRKKLSEERDGVVHNE